MVLLNVFCKAWVARLEALMTSTSELIFYTVLLTFRAKCREFAAKSARYFGVVDQIIRLNATAPRLSAALRDFLANRHTQSYDFV